eukprot:CAMPEP_0168621434 /NCGR_PEP_ID=MMETSP0449_2-20121227/7689_1 /TAXON_ID=1082188 /ORGANISM="Strombidium rassoulzadegani, Strain ras09" /LENGTH=67 /DNA_ID=CAMNT_0008662547 /DNA_START=335 /DNA_END=535 /DNA_ORIENTATION=-
MVLDKAEATRFVGLAIKAHMEVLDPAAHLEECEELVLRCEGVEVADVERGRSLQPLLVVLEVESTSP